MKILTPKKVLVNQVWLYTRGHDHSIERKFFMGNWSKDIDRKVIESFLSENPSILISMITTKVIGEESKIDVVMIPTYIEKGVIFENPREYVGFFSTGLTPKEFYDYTEFVEGIGNEKLQGGASIGKPS